VQPRRPLPHLEVRTDRAEGLQQGGPERPGALALSRRRLPAHRPESGRQQGPHEGLRTSPAPSSVNHPIEEAEAGQHGSPHVGVSLGPQPARQVDKIDHRCEPRQRRRPRVADEVEALEGVEAAEIGGETGQQVAGVAHAVEPPAARVGHDPLDGSGERRRGPALVQQDPLVLDLAVHSPPGAGPGPASPSRSHRRPRPRAGSGMVAGPTPGPCPRHEG